MTTHYGDFVISSDDFYMCDFCKKYYFSVQVYLDINRPVDELYYEKFDNVAVMFASLTDYKLGVENDADLNDKFLLQILDEVISDFDRVN